MYGHKPVKTPKELQEAPRDSEIEELGSGGVRRDAVTLESGIVASPQEKKEFPLSTLSRVLIVSTPLIITAEKRDGEVSVELRAAHCGVV